jgi:hypothetical protein
MQRSIVTATKVMVLAITLTLLWGFAVAQTLYIPLDNRPPNWAPCNWGQGIRLVVCPPAELYKGRDGVDTASLAQWLLGTKAGKAIVSLDALVYGGLVQSRSTDTPLSTAKQRLAVLLQWKIRYGGEVAAFGVIPRHPDAKYRERNLELLRSPLATNYGISYIEAPWDDALNGSPAISEAKTLTIPSRPGADEAGQVLLLRALAPGLRVKVVYDDPAAANQITRYEGIPLKDSVSRILAAAKAQPVEKNPELVLLVYTGADPRKGTLAVVQALRTGPVAVADIARVNRGDASLVGYLVQLGVYADLVAYASWGTPGNNLGAALAQGGLFLPGACERLWSTYCSGLRKQVLAQAYLEYLWGEVGRPWIRARFPEPLTEEAGRYVLERLQTEPSLQPMGLILEGITFPWQRSFEAGWRFKAQ